MITYGWAKGYMYTGDGTLHIKVRIPSVHGPYSQFDYGGRPIRNYVADDDLPWYPSMLLPHMPQEGEIVVISSLDSGNSEFIVLGLTGGSYITPSTNIGG